MKLRGGGLGLCWMLWACAQTPTEPARPVLDDSDFAPLPFMAEIGRTTPVLTRRCVPGMDPGFAPADRDYVVRQWWAEGEVLRFVVQVVPALLDRAETEATQRNRRDRYLPVASLQVGEIDSGGFIYLRRRPARPAGMLVRETLLTEDLWMRDGASRSLVYFDGRIDYGAADREGLPKERLKVVGWTQVHRLDDDVDDLPGAFLRIRLDQHPDAIVVDGTFGVPCQGRISVEGEIRDPSACPGGPAGLLGSMVLRRQREVYRLRQDAGSCDGCAWWEVGDEPPVRLCTSVWEPPGGTPDSGAVAAPDRRPSPS